MLCGIQNLQMHVHVLVNHIAKENLDLGFRVLKRLLNSLRLEAFWTARCHNSNTACITIVVFNMFMFYNEIYFRVSFPFPFVLQLGPVPSRFQVHLGKQLRLISILLLTLVLLNPEILGQQ